MTSSIGTATANDGAENAARSRSRMSGQFFVGARPVVLLAFRCAVAALFLLHPIGALGLLDGSTPEIPVALSVVEILCALLVAVGLFARPAAFLLSGMMAFAFFVIHLPGGWNWMENGGEPAALYSWIFLLLFVLGPGRLSLDARRRRDPAAV